MWGHGEHARKLVTPARAGLHVYDIAHHSEEAKNSPCAAGNCGNILGKMWHLLAQLLCSMLCSCYELLSEQHLGMDG